MAKQRQNRTSKQGPTSNNSSLDADRAAGIAEFAAAALVAAEQFGLKTRRIGTLPLEDVEREVLLAIPSLTAKLRTKLAKTGAAFTVADIASLTMYIAEALIDAEPKKQLILVVICQDLLECLADNLPIPKERAKKPKASLDLYQFKITLLESRPPIWRRIQVFDCTLDKLHEYIQTAMGWTNSHLHQFQIGEELFGDPMLLEENFLEMGYGDSTITLLSEVLPKSGKSFRFRYEYDFGDSWQHEVCFEGRLEPTPDEAYPFCVEGERACPPEDVGGIWGYSDFLKAIWNKNDKRHREMKEWVGGDFDPEAFDPLAATAEMGTGLPDWRLQM